MPQNCLLISISSTKGLKSRRTGNYSDVTYEHTDNKGHMHNNIVLWGLVRIAFQMIHIVWGTTCDKNEAQIGTGEKTLGFARTSKNRDAKCSTEPISAGIRQGIAC